MTPNSELDRLFPAIPKPDPLGVMCGGCGERNPGRRCIGCLHDFGPVDADETNHGPCAQGIAAMSKHTPGPWGIERTYDTNWIGFMRPHDPKKVQLIVCTTSRESLTDEALARNDANARLIAAAPELLAIVTRELRNGEQSHFEDWLERTCPSGDVEAVERQWARSADYAVFADEYREELAVIDKIEGKS